MLRPAQAREILARLLRNLKQIYVGRDDLARALACVNATLLFSPDDGPEFRDRGILYRKLECFAPALRDLERYLTLAPDDEAADEIRASLSDLRRQVERLQ
jgi:regulator of sirC expression with transglutaminase-like and TPR domain